jgi:putative transcriptional regulator
MKSLQGHFLVAAPGLLDPNFYRSVVLLIKHDEEGAFGLILNRPTENTVGEIWKAAGYESVECPDPIYLGGPVSGPLVAIHRLKEAAEAEVMPGVYFAARRDKLQLLVGQSTKPFRFFTGYSGWAGGQLESELAAGGWLVARAKKDLLFCTDDNLWEQIVHALGEDLLEKMVKPRHMPPDPSLN